MILGPASAVFAIPWRAVVAQPAYPPGPLLSGNPPPLRPGRAPRHRPPPPPPPDEARAPYHAGPNQWQWAPRHWRWNGYPWVRVPRRWRY
ncbi:MAG: hypothetical protein WB611_30570 [Stellaceae bacterium]